MSDGESLIGRVDEAAGLRGHRLRRRRSRRCRATRGWRRSRSGSTSTCSCLSRWPQMATLATPGTAINRGLTVQRTIVVISVCDSVGDVMPIFIRRLSDDSGASITGGCAVTGSCEGPSVARRSCTCCRASIRSRRRLENQDDRRQSEDRFGSNRLDARHTRKRALNRNADERLDFRRREPRCLGLDFDQRRGEFGKDVERNVGNRAACRGERRQ